MLKQVLFPFPWHTNADNNFTLYKQEQQFCLTSIWSVQVFETLFPSPSSIVKSERRNGAYSTISSPTWVKWMWAPNPFFPSLKIFFLLNLRFMLRVKSECFLLEISWAAKAIVLVIEWGSSSHGAAFCPCKEAGVIQECSRANRFSCLVQIDLICIKLYNVEITRWRVDLKFIYDCSWRGGRGIGDFVLVFCSLCKIGKERWCHRFVGWRYLLFWNALYTHWSSDYDILLMYHYFMPCPLYERMLVKI